METDADVIVVGAGLAGLAAAAAASREGARVVVLEAHQSGGRARTTEREGFVLNLGPHALYRRGAGSAVLSSLGVTPEGAPPPLARYRAVVSGRRRILPASTGTLLRTGAVGPVGKVQLAKLLATMGRIDPTGHGREPLARWIASLRLRPDAEAVLRALVRLSTYSADTEELSADAAIAQLQIAARGVLYLHGGWSQLVDALSDSLEVRTGVPVVGIDRAGSGVEVRTAAGSLIAHRVVLAAGGPSAVRKLLPADPGWGELGPPLTAACLDLGVRRVPTPGYLLSFDEPLYVTVQSPPARQAPPGRAVVTAIRYGARAATEDRPELERLVAEAGVDTADIVTSRFLAHVQVTGAVPRASTGGLRGRPAVSDTGVPGAYLAGDWVGPVGLLADASLASGYAAGRLAVQRGVDSSKMVG
ncbi:MAG: FAD-dependent oxidoreductase [Acidimicrobiales bacterium]